MSEKQYIAKVVTRTPRPRSKRLREAGIGSTASTSVIISSIGSIGGSSGGSSNNPDWHTHTNLDTLEQISTDADGYEYLTQYKSSTDEDGNDIELEYVDALEHEGQTYMAFFPAVEDEADEESEDYGLVILKSVTENGEELLSTLDDEAELEKIYELFMEQLLADEEENS